MESYIPLIKLHPEKKLHPVSDYNVSINFFHSRFDYVEELYQKRGVEGFYWLVKKNQFGILQYKKTLFGNSAKILIPCKYDSIEKLPDNRFKAILDGQVFYFDTTGKRMP